MSDELPNFEDVLYNAQQVSESRRRKISELEAEVERLRRAASQFWWTDPPRELPEDELRNIRLGISLSPNSWCMSWQQRAGTLGVRAHVAEDRCAKLVEALKRLSFAAMCRDNTNGDPCRLIEVKAELAAANEQAIAALAKVNP